METNIIYNEDCIQGLKRMPDKSVDLILTDPPYNIGDKDKLTKVGNEFVTNNEAWGEWSFARKVSPARIFQNLPEKSGRF